MESGTEYGKMYCFMCGETMNMDGLIVWKHPLIYGVRAQQVVRPRGEGVMTCT